MGEKAVGCQCRNGAQHPSAFDIQRLLEPGFRSGQEPACGHRPFLCPDTGHSHIRGRIHRHTFRAGGGLTGANSMRRRRKHSFLNALVHVALLYADHVRHLRPTLPFKKQPTALRHYFRSHHRSSADCRRSVKPRIPFLPVQFDRSTNSILMHMKGAFGSHPRN